MAANVVRTVGPRDEVKCGRINMGAGNVKNEAVVDVNRDDLADHDKLMRASFDRRVGATLKGHRAVRNPRRDNMGRRCRGQPGERQFLGALRRVDRSYVHGGDKAFGHEIDDKFSSVEDIAR